tara:strand:- start:197 stop:670 length:474 start_codon:yes stop_codon:yes gene_type:complete
MKQEKKSLVGRYLKMLEDNANGSPFNKGEYHKIEEDNMKGTVSIDGYCFGGKDYSWERTKTELIPDGFKPYKVENKSILLEAENIVNGDRDEQYSDPNIAFTEYSEILKATFGIDLTPSEICKVQMAIKLGRIKYKYKRDSIVDLCGYAEILNRLEK